MEDSKNNDASEISREMSRRAALKVIAGAPLTLIFALTLSPLMRYFKPTMQPFDAFQKADGAVPAKAYEFTEADFPEVWTCIPFNFELSYVEFNPEGRMLRSTPSYIIRRPDRYVAFSRRCPYYRCSGLLEYVKNRVDVNCGCAPGEECCCVRDVPLNPVLFCPRHESIFDVADHCKAVHGIKWIRPRELEIKVRGDMICVTGFDQTYQMSGIV